MNDIGIFLLSVRVDVFHAEALGQLEIDLDGDEGVLLTVDVLDLDIQLGTVEGCFARRS